MSGKRERNSINPNLRVKLTLSVGECVALALMIDVQESMLSKGEPDLTRLYNAMTAANAVGISDTKQKIYRAMESAERLEAAIKGKPRPEPITSVGVRLKP